MNFTKGLSTLLSRIQGLVRGRAPISLPVASRQENTAVPAPAHEPGPTKRTGPRRGRRTANLARCRCAHRGLLPVWCPRHRAYVCDGVADRALTVRNARGKERRP